MASDYESALLETWQRKPDAVPVLLSDNLRKEREIAALREQLATTASDGDQTLTMLVNAQNGALLAEVERLRQRSRDEDTARIRLNGACIKAEAERDALAAQVAALRTENERLAGEVRKLLRANGELALLWAEDQERISELTRALGACQGVIHEGLHGGRATDPEHQAACALPACRGIRQVLAVGEIEG